MAIFAVRMGVSMRVTSVFQRRTPGPSVRSHPRGFLGFACKVKHPSEAVEVKFCFLPPLLLLAFPCCHMLEVQTCSTVF